MIIVLLAKGRPGPAIATPKMPACGFSALACFRKCYILVHTDGVAERAHRHHTG